MALMQDWYAQTDFAVDISAATRQGILNDIEAWVRTWYDSHKNTVLFKKRILLWTIEIKIKDCVGILRVIFGDDFDKKVYIPTGTGADL